jgi:hypothetical protein
VLTDRLSVLNSLLQGGGTEDEAAARGSKSPPAKKQPLECPRCRSTNTKFCYYNNYSTAQPRHLCRACRRYWTHGGTLRDVPVGGATRRRAVSAEPPSSSSAPAAVVDQQLPDARLQTDLLSPTGGFPFLSDGSYLLPQPQFDPAVLFAPASTTAAFSWPSPVLPDFYDGGFAPPAWDHGTTVVAALGDIPPALQFAWPPPPGN